MAGSAPDATEALEQVERVEATTGQTVASTTTDCAYGSGETRAKFAAAGRVLRAKIPAEGENQGLFPKRAFVIDLEQRKVTCPEGQTTGEFIQARDGSKTFHFGVCCAACPLREYCTRAAGGRTLRVHAQEELLQAARAEQATPAGREQLRQRVVVEHGLARLGQLGIGQARYLGRQKTRLQLLLLAAVANLRWTWNWEEKQPAAGGRATGERRKSPAQATATACAPVAGSGAPVGRYLCGMRLPRVARRCEWLLAH